MPCCKSLDNVGSMNCDSLLRKRKRSCSPSEVSTISNTERSIKEENATPLTPLTPSTPRPVYPSEKKTFTCPYEDCGKAYNRPARLQDHLRSHTDERPFKCSHELCDKSFRRQSHLSQHVKSSHTAIRDYACDFDNCNKRFLTATRLKRHRDVHLGQNKYRCVDYPPCSETFRKKSTLQKHIDVEHLQCKPFRCTHIDSETKQECDAGYDSAAKLRSHASRAHGPVQHVCTLCDVRSGDNHDAYFTSPAELQRHIKLIHPPTCEHCGLGCSTPYELSIHIDTKHGRKTLDERRVFQCTAEGCDKAFTKRSNLNIHTRSAHSADHAKSFVCGRTNLSDCRNPELVAWDAQNGCGRGFTAKASLSLHILKQHLNPPARRLRPAKGKRNDSTNEEESSTLSRLTGTKTIVEARRIACVDSRCAWRFKREYDLRVHAQKAHGLSDAEVTEAVMEREALSGGTFWCGGVDMHLPLEEEGDDNDDDDVDDDDDDYDATCVEDGEAWNVGKLGLPLYTYQDPRLHITFHHKDSRVGRAMDEAIDPALK